ncbi:MAG: 2-isopropylmalate synthase [Deltaproteobacteria bacterium]|nr:2-isopropylmalate synthase [Deltaproteobacteria bacterium]
MTAKQERIIIFDTTLRDGEQAPGFSMNPGEKLRFARQLEKLRVDVIEAGFPVASPGDFNSVRQIAREIRRSQVAALARTEFGDIDRAWEAICDAVTPRIHTFISTSDIHMHHMLKKTRKEVLAEACRAVERARSYTENVEFSAQDATRTNRDYLCEVVEAVIAAGATTVNIPDTVGYAVPDEFRELLSHLFSRVRTIDQAVISVHCHDDLGLAVANSLAALKCGVRQVECTINGIGERAGNASLEEIVMALETRKDVLGLSTRVRTQQIYNTSKLLSDITGIQVQPNKAIVGDNAFAHEAGIHQDGFYKERTTYEIMTPAKVGVSDASIVLGKHSGRHAVRERLKKLGFNPTREELDLVFTRFKEVADMKKQVFDEDLESIISDVIFRRPDTFKLLHINVMSGNVVMPTATVRMEIRGQTVQDAGCGVGPVDAAYTTIRKLTRTNHRLLKYQVNAVTEGIDALGIVSVQLKYRDRVIAGRAADPDVIVASAKAYIDALNRLESLKSNGKTRNGDGC